MDGKLYQIDSAPRSVGYVGPRCGSNSGWTDRWQCAMANIFVREECPVADKAKAKTAPAVKPAKARRSGRKGSDWNKNFDLKKGPKVWQAAEASGYKRSAGS